MTNMRWKAGRNHPYYYDSSKFGGTNVPVEGAVPSANVQGCFKNPNNRGIAYVQLVDDTYRTITYNAYEHIMKLGMPTVASGERNEGTYNAAFNDGDVVRYGCYHKLPTGWTDDSPANRFMIMQQWHQQAPTGSPPHHLAYGRSGTSGKLLLQPKYNDVDVTDEAQMVELFVNQWVYIETEFKWSTGSDGYMKIYRGGGGSKVLIFTGTGANIPADGIPYWKFGLYRDPDIDQDNSVWTKFPLQKRI